MRNLKKMLSLVMALAMVASFMVVGASAKEFTDVDDIKNIDAVNTLVTLGVIDGRDTGAFDPTGIVTRAELAKMVCVAINGGTDPVLGTTTATSYKDTVGHWASGYIEYCTNLEIVSGDGAGNFNPNATVTGAQAAKMLLVTLGYDPTVFGFTGANWQVNTDVQANSAKLYNGLKGMNSAEGLTRDNAALMVYNALSANVMIKSYDKIMSNGEISYSYALSKTETLLSEKFGVVTVEGIVVGNEFSNLSGNQTAKTAGETVIKVTNDGDGQDVYNNGNATFKVTTGADVLGRSVSLFVKPSATSESNASKGTVIGGVMLGGDNVVVTDSGIKKLSKLADDNDLKLVTAEAGDSAADKAAATQVAANYGNQTHLNAAAAGTANVRGVLVTLIDHNGDDTVDYVITERHDFGKVSKYSTKDDGSITVTGIGAVSKDDAEKVVGFEDVKKGDYVLYAEIGGKLYVEKPETVEGKITAYKNTTATASGTVTMDGTKYTASGLFGYSDSSKLLSPGDINAFSSATAYLDKQGYIVAIGDSVEESGNFALVLGYASGTAGVDSNRVKVALSDGTTGTYTVNECRDNANTNDEDPVIYRLYTYSMTDDKEINLREIAAGQYKGTNYLTQVSTGAAGSAGAEVATDFSKGKTTLDLNGTKYYADSSTAFFYATSETGYLKKADVYTGIAKATSVDDTVNILVITAKDDAKVAKAVVMVDATAATNGDFLYLVKYTGETSNGLTFRAIVGNDFLAEEITVKSGANEDDIGAFEYTINSKGNYELAGRPTQVAGIVDRDPTSRSIVIDALGTAQDGEYELLSNSIIAYIDGDDTYTEAEVGKGDAVTIVYNTDKEIEGIYITAAQADDATDVVDYDTANVTLAAGKYQIEAGTSYDAVDEILAAFLPSSGATALLNKADPGAGQTAAQLAALISAGDTADTFTATTINYLIIIAADGESYSVTPVEIVAP